MKARRWRWWRHLWVSLRRHHRQAMAGMGATLSWLD